MPSTPLGLIVAEGADGLPERPSMAIIVITGILALVFGAIGWPILRHLITIAHEGGHATATSMSGGKVNFVKLWRTSEGVTDVYHPAGLPGVIIAAAGYLGPSFFGLLGALLLHRGHVEATLWVSLVLLAILLLQVANWFGGFTVVTTGVVVFLVARYASEGPQALFACTLIWFLLIGGFGHVVGLRNLRRTARAEKKRDEGSDAFVLSKQTRIPAPFWVAFFWLGSAAALVFGAGIMLGLVF